MRQFSFIRMPLYEHFPWKNYKSVFPKEKQRTDLYGNSQTVLTDFLQLLKDYQKLRWADAHYGRWGIEKTSNNALTWTS